MYGELRAGASPERGARSGDRYGGSQHPPSAQELVSRRQGGFKAHLAAEPDTGIITDCALTKTATPRPGLRPAAVALRAVSPHVGGVVTRLSGCPKTSSAFGTRN